MNHIRFQSRHPASESDYIADERNLSLRLHVRFYGVSFGVVRGSGAVWAGFS